MIEQSQDQGLGENGSRTEAKIKRTVQRTGSSIVASPQRRDKEMVARIYLFLPRFFSRSLSQFT